MSKLFTIIAQYATIGTTIRRTIDSSPEFSGVQTSDSGQPDRQLPPGGFITG